MKKPRLFSPGYQKMLKKINASTALQSVLYDMGLLPELVNDKKTRSTRECLVALMIGYHAGHLEAQEKMVKDSKTAAAKAALLKRLKS